ncbi:MAG TPA: EscU/YscU/HrcU family type III secretion system export apparatus switch protein, partial [Chloroflexota bacterium]|nr:EscU/YscU/HrcU family type III secretion system export apparatus switch protein [Chloroflexota bacterium]
MPANDKTEKATPKRREDARKQGQVPRSTEINTAVALLVGWLAMRVFGERTLDSLRAIMSNSFLGVFQPELTESSGKAFALDHMIRFGQVMLPIASMLMLAALLSNVMQVGLHITPKAAAPKFSRLNPISGVQRLFNVRSLAELAKSVLKLSLVGFLCYHTINAHLLQLMMLTGGDFKPGMEAIGQIVMELVLKVGLAYIVLAGADYAFQRWQFEKSIKMTKQEIKEEARSQDLAPELKSRI